VAGLASDGAGHMLAKLRRYGKKMPKGHLYVIILASAMRNPDMLTLNSIIQRDPEVIAAEADQDLIMVSVATGSYYGLSDVARDIWDAIEQPKMISDLVDDLTASYQIDSCSCEEQTLSFLEALRDEGLLRVEDGSAG
jgi:hypothetical protein